MSVKKVRTIRRRRVPNLALETFFSTIHLTITILTAVPASSSFLVERGEEYRADIGLTHQQGRCAGRVKICLQAQYRSRSNSLTMSLYGLIHYQLNWVGSY